jgi:peptidyl-prolyl cis-trans isomerase-like 4
VVIEDPFEDITGMRVPSRSPSPVIVKKKKDLLSGDQEEDPNEYPDYLDDDVDLAAMMHGKTEKELEEEAKEHQTKTRAAVLEILEDLPDADVEPPKNVLFVCKLNPVTQSHDLELIFSRFGAIRSCEVIRDWKTGDSLQYAFIEFETEENCIAAYTKMDGVLIDERRIHADFSQSVAKLWNTHRRRTMK